MLRKSWEIVRNQLTISCQIVANISKLQFCLINIKLYVLAFFVEFYKVCKYLVFFSGHFATIEVCLKILCRIFDTDVCFSKLSQYYYIITYFLLTFYFSNEQSAVVMKVGNRLTCHILHKVLTYVTNRKKKHKYLYEALFLISKGLVKVI